MTQQQQQLFPEPFRFPPELASTIERGEAARQRRRRLDQLAATAAADHQAAIAAREQATEKRRDLAASIALAEAEIDGEDADVSTLRQEFAAAGETLRAAEETISKHDATIAGIAKKRGEVEAELLALADELRAPAAAFRREVLQALAEEYLAAVRSFVRAFPRWHAIADVLRLPFLGRALGQVSLPHPAEDRGLLSGSCLYEAGFGRPESVLNWQDSPDLVAQRAALAPLAELERFLGARLEQASAQRRAAQDAANRAGRDRAFAPGARSAGSQAAPPPPAPRPESTWQPKSYVTTWREPPSPGAAPTPPDGAARAPYPTPPTGGA